MRETGKDKDSYMNGHKGENDMSYRFRAAGKRMGVIASGAALVCLLASCALSGKDESSGSGQPGDAAGEGQTPLSPAESYRAVLLEERDFISTDLRNKK